MRDGKRDEVTSLSLNSRFTGYSDWTLRSDVTKNNGHGRQEFGIVRSLSESPVNFCVQRS